jgi:hypothetical protein
MLPTRKTGVGREGGGYAFIARQARAQKPDNENGG